MTPGRFGFCGFCLCNPARPNPGMNESGRVGSRFEHQRNARRGKKILFLESKPKALTEKIRGKAQCLAHMHQTQSMMKEANAKQNQKKVEAKTKCIEGQPLSKDEASLRHDNEIDRKQRLGKKRLDLCISQQVKLDEQCSYGAGGTIWARARRRDLLWEMRRIADSKHRRWKTRSWAATRS